MAMASEIGAKILSKIYVLNWRIMTIPQHVTMKLLEPKFYWTDPKHPNRTQVHSLAVYHHAIYVPCWSRTITSWFLNVFKSLFVSGLFSQSSVDDKFYWANLQLGVTYWRLVGWSTKSDGCSPLPGPGPGFRRYQFGIRLKFIVFDENYKPNHMINPTSSVNRQISHFFIFHSWFAQVSFN